MACDCQCCAEHEHELSALRSRVEEAERERDEALQKVRDLSPLYDQQNERNKERAERAEGLLREARGRIPTRDAIDISTGLSERIDALLGAEGSERLLGAGVETGPQAHEPGGSPGAQSAEPTARDSTGPSGEGKDEKVPVEPMRKSRPEGHTSQSGGSAPLPTGTNPADRGGFEAWHRRECPNLRIGVEPCGLYAEGRGGRWDPEEHDAMKEADERVAARFKGRACREVYAAEHPGERGGEGRYPTDSTNSPIDYKTKASPRDEALEEAARIVEDHRKRSGGVIYLNINADEAAAAIRALKRGGA